MAKDKNNKKFKDNSIAGRIKNAMVKTSIICLAALGVVSLDASNEEKIAILQSKVKQYAYTGYGYYDDCIYSSWDV